MTSKEAGRSACCGPLGTMSLCRSDVPRITALPTPISCRSINCCSIKVGAACFGLGGLPAYFGLGRGPVYLGLGGRWFYFWLGMRPFNFGLGGRRFYFGLRARRIYFGLAGLRVYPGLGKGFKLHEL
jgi:hypothetical protein